MILERLKYPGASNSFFLYAGALTPTIEQTVVSTDVGGRGVAATAGPGPKFSRRNTVPRNVDIYKLTWSPLTEGEADLVLLDYEAAAKRGTRRLSYTPDDRTSPVPVLISGRPKVERFGASQFVVEMELVVQS